MKKYAISPSEIHVKQGDSVRLEIATTDVQHGFEVPDLKISEPVNPGKPASVVLKTDRKGAFRIECGIICGPKHEDMYGKIIVE